MSRSLGDGECKAVGVIPDPSLSHVTIDAASSTEGDGDLFIIVASDGVWEFIESEEACRIVGAHLGNATEACTALVQEAAARWKRFEGSYRDDITAIVALLPFLEAGWADEDEEEEDGDEVAPLEEGQIFINAGMKGLSKVTAPGAAEGGGQAAGQAAGRAAGQAGGPAAAEQESASEREEAEKNEFASRRLSVRVGPPLYQLTRHVSSGRDLLRLSRRGVDRRRRALYVSGAQPVRRGLERRSLGRGGRGRRAVIADRAALTRRL